jgi:hypothetical protein
MNFDWKEYLALAHFLQQHSAAGLNQEAAQRSAVSRAYFAAFCHARNYARDRHGLTLSYTGDDHFQVKRHFSTRRERGVAPKLDRLRQWRNQCDYEDSVANLATLPASALQEAQMVIAILK